jgi:GT2 family glycosyltransferase
VWPEGLAHRMVVDHDGRQERGDSRSVPCSSAFAARVVIRLESNTTVRRTFDAQYLSSVDARPSTSIRTYTSGAQLNSQPIEGSGTVATAVINVDLERIPSALKGLERYEEALVLLFLRGYPVGQVRLPVVSGCIGGAELRIVAAQAAEAALQRHWLHEFLGWQVHADVRPAARRAATVAVCTRDRTADLRRCLTSLLCLPDDGQEILIIDNAPSTDSTRDLVEHCPSQRVRYVREERAGLDIARNRALREARGEIVAFADDDTVVHENWLRALAANFEDPMTLSATGLVMPLELETPAQEWFERYTAFGRGFQRVVFDGTRDDPLVVGRVGAGASMAMRRDVYTLVGPFDEALDAGTPTRSGGDHEMFSRILRVGYKIVYDPTALSWHHHRRTWQELRATVYGYGVGVYARFTRQLFLDSEPGVVRQALGWFRHEQAPRLAQSLLGRPDRVPLDLLIAELVGCLRGPWAYLSARQASARHLPRPPS